MNMMKIPDGMKHKVADISPGTTYGVGVDTDGKVYIWGYTRITDTIDLKNIPEEVQNAKIVNVAAGYDHIVALDDWGNKRLGQDSIPDKLQMAAAYGKNLGIKQIEASNQFSAAVTEDGELFLWGNGNQADIKIKKEYQGNIEKVALTARAYVALTKDGAVVYSGFQKDNALVRIPEGLDSGVVDNDIQCAERLHGKVHHCLYLVLLGYIDGKGLGCAAGSVDFLSSCRGCFH